MLEETELMQRSFEETRHLHKQSSSQTALDQTLSREEKKAIVTLTILYLIQGIPLGFFGGALGILFIDAGASFENLAILSTVVLPFSFKMVTAPILDTFYFPSVGKRRSYILPIQYIMGFLFLLLSVCDLELWIAEHRIWLFTLIGTFMIFLIAQQDIAVDGWVLTSLSEKYVHIGASCQSIGQILGNIYSSSVLISLNSAAFCNTFIYSEPQKEGVLSLQLFCLITGVIVIVVTMYVNFFTTEKPEEMDPISISLVQNKKGSAMKPYAQVKHSVKSMCSMLNNKNVLMLILYLVTFRYSYSPMQSSFGTILQKNGFPKELLSTVSTLFVPVAILIPLIVGAKIKQGTEFTWLFILYKIRFFDVVLQYIIVLSFDSLGGFNYITATLSVSYIQYYFKIISMFFNYCLMNITFIIHSGFFNRVSDSDVGGTYLTFLNSSHNLGSTVANSFSLYLIGVLGFDFVIILSLIYSIVYYVFCRETISELQTYNKYFMKEKKNPSGKSKVNYDH